MRLNHLFSQWFAKTVEKRVLLSRKVKLNISFCEAEKVLKTISIELEFFSGAHSGVATHVPFPNTVVKDSSGDGTVNLTMGE